MMVDLSYGRGTLQVRLPDSLAVTVIRKPPMPVLAEPSAAVSAALAAPVAARPLSEEARGARERVHRGVRHHPAGPERAVPAGPIVRTLLEAGVAPRAHPVLVATGLHRPNVGAELAS